MAEITMKIGYTARGAYDAATTYDRLDVVSAGHGVYASKVADNVGHAVSDTGYWDVLISPTDIDKIITDINESASSAAAAETTRISNENTRIANESTRVAAEAGRQAALDGKLDKASVKQAIGTSTTDVMSQKAVTDELALKVDKSTQGMKLLADYTHNTNVVLPQVESIDYATSTVTFTAPHGLSFTPQYYKHKLIACINDYTITTNYKAVPTGLQSAGDISVAEIISPTSLRLSNSATFANYVLPNVDSTFVDFTKWHFEYLTMGQVNILIERSVAIKVVQLINTMHGYNYVGISGNQTQGESANEFGSSPLGLGHALIERTFFIGANGLVFTRTFGAGNAIRSAGLSRIDYNWVNMWRYNDITYIDKVTYQTPSHPAFGNGTRILVYKLA